MGLPDLQLDEDGFAWWKARFVKMAEYFDAYRIDHILGFFRIWEIPLDAVNALLGHFNPALSFSQEEIAAYGFHFNREAHTAPVNLAEQRNATTEPNHQRGRKAENKGQQNIINDRHIFVWDSGL